MGSLMCDSTVEKKSAIATDLPAINVEEAVAEENVEEAVAEEGVVEVEVLGVNPDVDVGQIFNFVGQSPSITDTAASNPPPSPIKDPTIAPGSPAAGMAVGPKDDAVYKPSKRRIGPTSSFSIG
jgi:hypothetical protein